MNAISPLSQPGRLANPLEQWEAKVELLPNVRKLETSDYLDLQKYLDTCENTDSYLTSAAYFFFTGRNGLWSYSDNGQKILLCWHPNRDGEILIFLPEQRRSWKILEDLLRVIPRPPSGLRIARVQNDPTIQLIVKSLNSMHARTIRCDILREDVLDWQYPVRILSTEQTAQMKGRKYNNVRSGVIRLKKDNPVKMPLDLNQHKKGITHLIHKWASHSAATKSEYFDLYESHISLMTMLSELTDTMEGLVTFIGGEIEAVALWNMSGGAKPVANLYANFCNTTHYGLAEFSMVSVCEVLQEKNIEFLNLGGSETPSLDFFKNKFRPAISIDLSSLGIQLDQELASAPQETIFDVQIA